MIIRGIDHNKNVVVCDGSEMLHDFDGLLFTYHGTTFKCKYDDNDETHIKWQITRRKYGGEPVIYYVNLLINKAIEMTIDDMYYHILADCCDDNGVIMEYISREDYCEENCGKENREGYKTCHNCGMLNVPSANVREKRYCKMIPLEPDCRGYTDVFICTNCHQHIHLGFIRQEYSGSFCIECGAEVKDGDYEC